MFADQSGYTTRFEWGERGLSAIGPGSRVIVVVDVLSFCTCVDVAVSRGAVVLPYRDKDESALRYAEQRDAILAVQRGAGYSLSPASLTTLPASSRLVLPSPNGAALSLAAAGFGITVAGCLRNAAAVAAFARSHVGPVAVLACGERWEDGNLRPAWEDLVGAGAVIAHLPGPHSPEAEAALAAFRFAKAELAHRLWFCASGRELIERGYAADVLLAGAVGVSECVPILSAGAFTAGCL